MRTDTMRAVLLFLVGFSGADALRIINGPASGVRTIVPQRTASAIMQFGNKKSATDVLEEKMASEWQELEAHT